MKKCSFCKEIKLKSEFYKNSNKKDGLGNYCKKCNTLWVRKRYLRNKKYYDDRNKESRLRNKKYILNFLRKNPCIDCGENDPIVLDFDHLKDKHMPVSDMVRKMNSIARIQIEIEKCVIRCSNCHRRKTAKEKGYYKYFGE